jgi:hypothetical protein
VLLYKYLHVKDNKIIVIFQVLMAASMKFRVFWDVASCSHIEVDQCFRGADCLHHHPDDEGSMHLWSPWWCSG